MKRTISIFIVLTLLLSGCASSGKMNLSAFIENYNIVSGKEIDFSVFIGHRSDNHTVYTFNIKEGERKVLVTLKEKDREIIECRITSIKIDENLNFIEMNEKNKALFIKAVQNVSAAFTANLKRELDAVVDNMIIDINAEERTETFRGYNMIFISNDLCAEFIIRDKQFYEDETTEKPENINSFLNTAPVRTETVPHR